MGVELFDFVDHVRNHFVDSAGVVEHAAAGSGLVEFEDEEDVGIGMEGCHGVRECVALVEREVVELVGGKTVARLPEALDGEPVAKELGFGLLQEFGFVIEAGIDLGFVFGEQGNAAVGFGDGPSGLGGVQETDAKDVSGRHEDGRGDGAVGDGCGVESDDVGVVPRELGLQAGDVLLDEVEVALGFVAKLRFELDALVVMMDGLDGLLEADGDEQAYADGGDVDEEVAPGVDGFVGWVDV